MIVVEKNLNEFKCILNVIEKLVMEVELNFSLDKLIIKAIHPSNHCLIQFEIDKEFFDEYNIKKQSIYILNSELLNKILKNLIGKVYIKSSLDVLTISDEKNNFNLNYFVGVNDNRDIPSIQSTCKWKINTKTLFDNISRLIDFSPVCKMGGNDLAFYIKTNFVNGNVLIDCSKIESDGSWCWYDITYFNLINGIKDIIESVDIEFGNQTPVIIKGKGKHFNFSWVLACRVEEEGEVK